jgi:hypothetical protein
MANIVNALLAEYGEIAADVSQNPDPRLVKLERITALLSTYGISAPATDNIAGRSVGPEKVPEFVTPHAPKEGKVPTKRDRVRDEAAGLMRRLGRVHRNAVLDRLIELKIMGHEKDPLASLAAYLSESRDIFATDGKGAWYLRALPGNGAHQAEGELPLAASEHL